MTMTHGGASGAPSEVCDDGSSAPLRLKRRSICGSWVITLELFVFIQFEFECLEWDFAASDLKLPCNGTLSVECAGVDSSPAAFSTTSTRKLRPSHRFSRFQKKVNSTRDLPASSAVRRSTNHRSRSIT